MSKNIQKINALKLIYKLSSFDRLTLYKINLKGLKCSHVDASLVR